ncbi:hypothetical protein C5167_048252, partial [Papaver somniferum]
VLLPESAVGDPSLQAFLAKKIKKNTKNGGGTGAIEINSEVISRLIATHTEDV